MLECPWSLTRWYFTTLKIDLLERNWQQINNRPWNEYIFFSIGKTEKASYPFWRRLKKKKDAPTLIQ